MTLILFALVGLVIAQPQSASAIWDGDNGCAAWFWYSTANTNPRVSEMQGINLNAAILDITGLNLGAPVDLTIDEAVKPVSLITQPLYRQAAAGVFNYYYGDPTQGMYINYISPDTFTSYIQKALDGNVKGAVTSLFKANTLGCPIDKKGIFNPPAGKSFLTIKTFNESGDEIFGYWTVLSKGGTEIKTGFSPQTFILNNGESYEVLMGDWAGVTFDHFEGGSIDMPYPISINTNTVLNAYYSGP